MWFVQERRRGTPISTPILTEKALIIHSKIENAPTLHETFMEVIDGDDLIPEQVYNMDEALLNFKMLPNKTAFISSRHIIPGFKKNKERITVGVCSNVVATIHKSPLFVIGMLDHEHSKA